MTLRAGPHPQISAADGSRATHRGLREEVLRLTADVDMDRLELAAARARRARTPAAYRAALSLYAGELLPENRYDDWVAERRDELAELAGEIGGGARGARLNGRRPGALPAGGCKFVHRTRRGARRAERPAPVNAHADARRDGRRGQDAACTRACPRRRAVIPRRSRPGRQRTWPSPAAVSTTPRPRCRKRAESSRRPSALAGSQTHSLGSPRSHCYAAMRNGRLHCSARLASATPRGTTRSVSRTSSSGCAPSQPTL